MYSQVGIIRNKPCRVTHDPSASRQGPFSNNKQLALNYSLPVCTCVSLYLVSPKVKSRHKNLHVDKAAHIIYMLAN